MVSENNQINGVLSLENLINEIETAYCCELEKVLQQRDIALQHSQRNLFLANKIIDSSLDGIMITDSNGVIMQVNPAFTHLTGYKEYEGSTLERHLNADLFLSHQYLKLGKYTLLIKTFHRPKNYP